MMLIFLLDTCQTIYSHAYDLQLLFFFWLPFKVFGIILIASCNLNGECYPGVLDSIPFSSKKGRSDLPVMGKVTSPGELGGNLIDVWQG